MARDYNGVNQSVDFGSDASIDDFALITVCAWARGDSAAVVDALVHKASAVTNGWLFLRDSTQTRFIRDFTTANGDWSGPVGSWPAAQLAHVAVSYDAGSVANDPVFYVDGVVQAVTENVAPVGTAVSDAAEPLDSGEIGAGSDLDGLLGHIVYHDAILSDAEINRARWYGSPLGGPSSVKVWHPLWTSDLNNRGTATANGTATGTTMDNASCPRVERCHAAMMGVGR